MPAALAALLTEHHQGTRFNAPEDVVFTQKDGSPLDDGYPRKQILYPAPRATGIEPEPRRHGFHLFRHSAGSIVHSITRDVRTAQELLSVIRA